MRRMITSRWLLAVVGVVVVVVVVAAVFLTAEPGIGADGDDEQTTAQSQAQDLGSLPDDAATGGEAAPQEVGGEPSRTCEACHPDYMEQPGTEGDLIFSHATHLDQEIECVTCHEPPLGHFETPAPMMMACLSCHEGETAPNECENCHRKLEEIAPGVDEPAVHLDPDPKTRKTCAKCHDVDVWCEQCHGVIMPHPASWKKQHGELALTQSDVCVKCHQSKDPTFCIDCHGVEMPHPAFWWDSHGDVAEANPDSCQLCHPPVLDLCNRCHHAGYQPTPQWAQGQHATAVAESGEGACLVCHERSFCDQCHAGVGQ